MTLILHRILLTVVCAGMALAVSAQGHWTLDKCLDYAREHNVEIQKRLVGIKQQQVNLNTSKSAWLPSADLSYDASLQLNKSAKVLGVTPLTGSRNNVFLTQGTIGAEMPVFDGFRIKNQIRSDQFLLQAAYHNLEKANMDLDIQISTYYLQCLYYKSIADVQRSQVSLSKSLVERSSILVDEGRKPMADLSNAQAQLAEDEYNLTDAEGKVTLALMELAQLMNIDNPEGFDVVDIDGNMDMPSIHAWQIYEKSVASFPSILAAESMIRGAEHAVEVARAGYYPQIRLVAGISTGSTYFLNKSIPSSYDMTHGDNLYEYVGLKVSMPLFNRNITRNNIRKAKLDIEDQQLSLSDARLRLNKDIQTAYTNAVVAKGEKESAEKAVAATELAMSYEQERYDAGRGNIFDLQMAQQKNLNAKMKVVQAKYEYLIRLRILDYYNK